jgi:ribosomal protein L17
MGTTHCAKRFTTMPNAKEFRQNAEDCLTLARETTEMYARVALIEMATEFRLMANHLERAATRRTADRIRRWAALPRRIG